MNLIKRLFLLIALVLTIFLNGTSFADEFNVVDFGGTISAVKSYENDFLNSRDNELSLTNVSESTSSISSRRNNSNTISNGNDVVATLNKFENTNLTTFEYKLSYEMNNSELALLLLSHQIQPNAP